MENNIEELVKNATDEQIAKIMRILQQNQAPAPQEVVAVEQKPAEKRRVYDVGIKGWRDEN